MIVAQTPPARSVSDETRQREVAIVNSRRYGIITQADHDAQLKSLRDPTRTATLSEVPVRTKGRKIVRDFRGQSMVPSGWSVRIGAGSQGGDPNRRSRRQWWTVGVKPNGQAWLVRCPAVYMGRVLHGRTLSHAPATPPKFQPWH